MNKFYQQMSGFILWVRVLLANCLLKTLYWLKYRNKFEKINIKTLTEIDQQFYSQIWYYSELWRKGGNDG